MKKRIRNRCWIEINGEKFFGPGPAELLERIDKTGSVAKAAKAMDMSYKKAWDLVSELNAKGSKPYVLAHKGGKKGGGAEVTPAGMKVLSEYRKLTGKLDDILSKHERLLSLI
ncbi:MAG TPA: ModE family transcriptional regulator [Cyclobacteriaceae bacterium]